MLAKVGLVQMNSNLLIFINAGAALSTMRRLWQRFMGGGEL